MSRYENFDDELSHQSRIAKKIMQINEAIPNPEQS